MSTHHGVDHKYSGPGGIHHKATTGKDDASVHTSLTTRSGNTRKGISYHDSSMIVPISLEFEFELNHRIYTTEGIEAVTEYCISNPAHISMSNPLLSSIPKAALGYITFYTLEITDPDADVEDGGTVQTGLTSAGFNSVYGDIRAYNMKENSYATVAASIVNVDMERYI